MEGRRSVLQKSRDVQPAFLLQVYKNPRDHPLSPYLNIRILQYQILLHSPPLPFLRTSHICQDNGIPYFQARRCSDSCNFHLFRRCPIWLGPYDPLLVRLIHVKDVLLLTKSRDCCKPSCAWAGNAPAALAPVKTCDAHDNPLSDANAQSGCNGGNGMTSRSSNIHTILPC